MEIRPYKEIYMISMLDHSENGSPIYYQAGYSTLELAEQKLDTLISELDFNAYISSFEEIMTGIDELFPSYHICYIPYDELGIDGHTNSYRYYTINKIYIDSGLSKEEAI